MLSQIVNIKRKNIICLKCDEKHYAKGYCKKHYNHLRNRWLSGNDPNIDIRLRNPKGQGGYNGNGYRFITKEHPNAYHKSSKNRILEHVYIMSQHLGRPLYAKETVHHINGIRDDNRIENLELWSSSHPPGQRVLDKLKFYKEYLELHGHTVIVNGEWIK